MSKHLVAHPEFVKAFVSECFSRGFNEKQSSELLDTYAKAEFYTTDEAFRAGVDTTIKEAGVFQALGQLGKAVGSAAIRNPAISVPVGAGIAAGGLMPSGIISDEYTGGAGTGAIAGGLLGLLATRGRGLGGALSRIGTAVRGGGVGRATAKEIGNLVSNPNLLKGLAGGAGTGLVATGTNNLMNEGFGFSGRLPKMDPNTGVPWYMRDQASGSSTSGNQVTGSNPFELPPEIMARVQGGAGAGAAAGSAGAAGLGPVGQLQRQRGELAALNTRISQLESSLPTGINPASYRQRQGTQAEIDNMKMRRNTLATTIGELQSTVDRDKFNISDLAAQRAQQAAAGSQAAMSEFDMLRRRQELANQGYKPGLGFGASPVTGTLMGLFNKLTGSERRLAELEPIYRGYQDQAEHARRLQELAQ